MTRTRRDLSSDDLKIWRYVTRNVNPLQPRHPIEDEAPLALTERPKHVRPMLETPSTPRASAPRPAPLNLGTTHDIDRRTAQRFKRGEMSVDGRLDLHGMTLDQAHSALSSFIRGAHARGARCVVVVTGKGKDGGVGKIRSEAPHWLNQASLRPLILAVSHAHIRDGGTGALYVLLKRKRG